MFLEPFHWCMEHGSATLHFTSVVLVMHLMMGQRYRTQLVRNHWHGHQSQHNVLVSFVFSVSTGLFVQCKSENGTSLRTGRMPVYVFDWNMI